jgi:hypothetical protein
MTDMDHVVTARCLEVLFEQNNKQAVYTLGRLEPDGSRTKRPDGSLKPHPNTFVITKELYWKIGGYDEDYCGRYGTDGLFRHRLFSYGSERHLHDACVIRYGREHIADASTVGLPRKEGRTYKDACKRVMEEKAKAGRANVIKTLDFKWEQIL